jgi:hypothetical protein
MFKLKIKCNILISLTFLKSVFKFIFFLKKKAKFYPKNDTKEDSHEIRIEDNEIIQ